jgi:hypothetical protein
MKLTRRTGATSRIARRKKEARMIAQRPNREAKARLKEVEGENEKPSEAEVVTPDDAWLEDVLVDDGPY